MGRARKINESTGKEFRTDRELVHQYQRARKPEKKMEAAYELWEKYFRLRTKMKYQLIEVCKRNDMYFPEIFEEYDSEAWIKFINQFDGIRLEDVDHLPNWSIYIRLWGYWRSMNRDLIRHWIDWRKNNTQISSIVKKDSSDKNEGLTNLDVETAKMGDQVETNLNMETHRTIFWAAIDELKNTLTDEQKKLLNMKYHGKKNREIAATLNITNKTINEAMVFIKQQLGRNIKEIASNKNITINYDDMLEVFG